MHSSKPYFSKTSLLMRGVGSMTPSSSPVALSVGVLSIGSTLANDIFADTAVELSSKLIACM